MALFQDLSRRQFLSSIGIAALAPAVLGRFSELVAGERKRAKIRDIQVMVMQGPRTYTLGPTNCREWTRTRRRRGRR